MTGHSLGAKLQVEPADVREGDFLTRDGFRRACAVEILTVTSGRGAKRATRPIATRVTYAAGDTIDLEHGGCHKDGTPRLETIYRPETTGAAL